HGARAGSRLRRDAGPLPVLTRDGGLPGSAADQPRRPIRHRATPSEEAPVGEVQTAPGTADDANDVRERVRPPSPSRRPTGRRDVAIVVASVVVSFALGVKLGLFDRLEGSLSPTGLDEAAGLAILAFAGVSALAIREASRARREVTLRRSSDARLRTLIE